MTDVLDEPKPESTPVNCDDLTTISDIIACGSYLFEQADTKLQGHVAAPTLFEGFVCDETTAQECTVAGRDDCT
jgi:hypothetical protein